MPRRAPSRERRDADTERREALVGKRDHQVAERAALGLHVAHRDAVEGIERGLERHHREHLRRGAEHRADAVGAREIVREGERRRMREPAGERLVERGEMALRHIDMRGRAGSAVEKLVAAADREVGAIPVEMKFDRAGRMREVPDDQRALLVRGLRDRRHVLDLGGAIVDVAELDHRGVGVDRGGDAPTPARSAPSRPSMRATLSTM